MAGESAVVVKITSIWRPVGITQCFRLSDPIRPFLDFEVEEQQLCRIQVKGRQVPAVGRPAWAIKTLRTRDSRDLMSNEVKDGDDLSFGSRVRGSPEGDLLAVGGPGRVHLAVAFRQH